MYLTLIGYGTNDVRSAKILLQHISTKSLSKPDPIICLPLSSTTTRRCFFANVNISIFMSFFVSSLFWFFYFTQSKSKLKITHETSFCLILKNLQNAIFHFLFRLIVLVWYQKLGHQWSQTEKMRIIIDQLCIGFQSTTTDLPN